MQPAIEYTSPEGWGITAPPGYEVQEPEHGGTVVRSMSLSISIETSSREGADPLDRAVGKIREDWRRAGAWIDDEKLEIGGHEWWHMQIHDASSAEERYIGDVGDLRVAIEARGDRGSVQRGQADVRAVVESFRRTR